MIESGVVDQALSFVRREGSQALRRAIAGNEQLTITEMASGDDEGWFGPDSVVWRVHASPAMLIGGLRALLLQTLHPLAMAGVADHSDYRDDPWGRLHRTGRFVGATTYGNTASAEAAVAVVRRVHERVKGFAPDGRPYSANDPHLLLWVHITEVDSFLRAHQRYDANPLSDAEADRYVAEMAIVAERLGSERPPSSMADLAEMMAAFRKECGANRQTRDALRFLLNPPVHLATRPIYGIISAAAVGLLPAWARRALWLPPVPFVEPLAVQPAAKAMTGAIGWFMGAAPPGTPMRPT